MFRVTRRHVLTCFFFIDMEAKTLSARSSRFAIRAVVRRLMLDRRRELAEGAHVASLQMRGGCPARIVLCSGSSA